MPLHMPPAITATGIAVFAALVTRIVGSSVTGDSTESAFHNFVEEHGRAYATGSDEHAKRLDLFRKRTAEIEAHNADPSRTWIAGVNHFTDRTDAELSAVLGYRPGRRPSQAGGEQDQAAVLVEAGEPADQSDWLNQKDWLHLSIANTIPDQGACGSCWAVATASVLDAHHEIHVGPGKRFSPQELVSCVANPHHCGGSGGCDGATVELGMAYALKRGLSTLTETPYEGKDLSCSSSSGLLDDGESGDGHRGGAGGHAFGLVGYKTLTSNSESALYQALLKGPVGVSVAAAKWYTYQNGIFGKDDDKKDNEKRDCGPVVDHAVTLYGIGGHGEDRYWLIRNSWGARWGEDGFIKLHRSENEEGNCQDDTEPSKGTGCDDGPSTVRVCGTCGILYDNVVPEFQKTANLYAHAEHADDAEDAEDAESSQDDGETKDMMPALQETAGAPEGERRAVQPHEQSSTLMRREN